MNEEIRSNQVQNGQVDDKQAQDKNVEDEQVHNKHPDSDELRDDHIQSYVQSYVAMVSETLNRYANPELAGPTAKYMKDQFSFLGMRAPQLQAATKEINRTLGVPDKSLLRPVIETLWWMPEREYQYLGTSLLGNSVKMFDEADIKLLEFSITHKPWWDTIDVIAKYPVGDYFIKFPHLMESRLNEWLASGDMWLQRTAILCQLGWKGKTRQDLLYAVIEHCIDPARCTNADEFFVRKAIGWALREYSKTSPESVERFVDTHPEMSGLSRREAMKVIFKRRA